MAGDQKRGRAILTKTITPAAEDIDRGKVVTVDGYAYDGTSPSDKIPIGISEYAAEEGDGISVVVNGSVMAEVGAGGIAAAGWVMAEKVTADAGKVIPYSAGAGNYAVGWTADTGSAGDFVEVFVNIQPD